MGYLIFFPKLILVNKVIQQITQKNYIDFITILLIISWSYSIHNKEIS